MVGSIAFSRGPSSSSPAVENERSVSTATPEGRLAVFDDVWETVRDRYYDPSMHGVDWTAARAGFRPQASGAAGGAQFYAVLRRMIGMLRDAHTRVYGPDETFDWEHPRFIGVGAAIVEVEGVPTVAGVERGTPADRAGMRPGDTVTEIDGTDALKLFAERLAESSGFSTTRAARQHAVASLFEGPAGSFVTVAWRDARGRRREASLEREWHGRDLELQTRRLRDGYEVMSFGAFTPLIAAELRRSLRQESRAARGLILDLRNNGGGETEALEEIASAFLAPGAPLGSFIDRGGTVRLEMETSNSRAFPTETRSFSAPLVVLVSEKTSSAAEIFVAALRRARRAYIIGASSCGCVLAIRHRHILPDGGELDISEMEYRTADGAALEGAGIVPDEVIEPTRDDLRAGRDRALERGLAYLKLLKSVPTENR